MNGPPDWILVHRGAAGGQLEGGEVHAGAGIIAAEAHPALLR